MPGLTCLQAPPPPVPLNITVGFIFLFSMCPPPQEFKRAYGEQRTKSRLLTLVMKTPHTLAPPLLSVVKSVAALPRALSPLSCTKPQLLAALFLSAGTCTLLDLATSHIIMQRARDQRSLFLPCSSLYSQ